MNNLINFKTRADNLGNIFANVSSLIPSKLNLQIYGNEDKENSKIDEIFLDMKKRLSKGLIANTVPIPVYPSGKMKGGHTRLLAAKKAGATEVQVNILTEEEEIEIKNNDYAEVMALLIDNTMSRDKDHEVILNEYNACEIAYVKQFFGQQPPVEEKKEWIKLIQRGTPHFVSLNLIDNLKIIKTRDPSLFEKIKSGKMTPNQAYKTVKKLNPKKIARTNRKILEVFKEKTNVKMFKHLFKNGIENFLKNNTVEYPDGEKINWVTDTYCGVESNYISNSFSQILQGSITAMFRKQYPNWDARTPRSEIGAPDTQFHAFNMPGYDPLRLESKCFDILSNVPTIYFGIGGAMINPHEFIIVAREGVDRFCIFVTTLSNENGVRDIKGNKSGGSSMTIQTWFDNHFDKKDWICLQEVK
jgi:hypothetical protein